MAGTPINLDLLIACFGPQPSALFHVSFHVNLYYKRVTFWVDMSFREIIYWGYPTTAKSYTSTWYCQCMSILICANNFQMTLSCRENQNYILSPCGNIILVEERKRNIPRKKESSTSFKPKIHSVIWILLRSKLHPWSKLISLKVRSKDYFYWD